MDFGRLESNQGKSFGETFALIIYLGAIALSN
jgi:hypothetical protein